MNRLAGWRILGVLLAAVVASCGDDPTGGGGGGGLAKQTLAQIEVNPTELHFSPLAPGDTQTLTLTVTNTGDGDDLKIKSVYVQDPDAPFAVTQPEETEIPVNEKTSLTVTYTAPEGATVDSVLIIKSSAATHPEVEVPLTVGQATTGLLIYPSPVDFGAVLGGDTKVIKLRIDNNETAGARITNVYFQMGGSPDFSIVDAPEFPVDLAPKTGTDVDLAYTPAGGGADSATLLVAVNEDGSPSLQSILVTGTEVGPELTVSPSKIDFGWVAVGETENLDLSIHNMGQFDLKVTKVYPSAGTNPDVSLASPPNSTITVEPGKAEKVTIAFAPKTYFPTTSDPIGGIVLETNDSDEAIVTVPVYGNIDAPFIKVDPADKVDFGIVAQGWTIDRTLTLQNVGHAPLVVDKLDITVNTPKGEFDIVEDPSFPPTLPGGGQATLQADEKVEVKLSFTNDGAASGTEVGKLQIHSNDAVTPDVFVDLSAMRGGSPKCSLAYVPGKLDFGTVAHGSSMTKPLFIKNTGSGYCSFVSGAVKKCQSFMGMMTTCSDNSGSSDNFFPQGMPIPVKDGMAPGTSHPVQILYKPPVTIPWIPVFEEYYGVMQVTYNEPYSVPGTYSQHKFPEPDNMGNLQWNIHGSSGVADIAVLPSEVAFGLVTIGCYSQTFCVRVYNAGTAPLEVKDIYTDGCGPEFQAKGYPELPVYINPSEYKEVCVVYLPQNEGKDLCHLVVESSDLDTPLFKVPLSGEGTWDTEQTDYFTQISGKKVDLLFVIDGSPSMCGEQDNVAQNFNKLTGVAAQWGNDYQIGIVHLDLGEQDSVSKLSGSPRILDKTTVGKFGANVDAIGCDKSSGEQEAGLEAGRRALTPPYMHDTDIPCSCGQDQPCPGTCQDPDICVNGKCGGFNSGLVRKDAALEVVFVSDEEDQSPGSVPFYIDFYKSIKGFLNEDMFHAHAIVGDWNSGCTISQDDGADAGNRYIEVQKATGGVFGSICDDSFASVLTDIGNKAFGLQVQFFLSAQADGTPGNIKVWVDAGGGYKECAQGWTYHPDTNSVEFDEAGPCMPQAGDKIKIWYKMVCNTQ